MSRDAPFRLVTLLEILQASAPSFWYVSSILGQALVRMETERFSDQGLRTFAGSLGDLEREADRLQLRSAKAQLLRIRQYVEDGHVTNPGLRSLVADLQLADAAAFAIKRYLERRPDGAEYFDALKGALTMLPKMEGVSP